MGDNVWRDEQEFPLARARSDALLPARREGRELGGRRRRSSARRAAEGGAGPLRVRPRGSGAHAGRPAVLRRRLSARARRPAAQRVAPRRARVLDAAAGEGPGGDGLHHRGDPRRDLRRRHGLHGHAGRRRPSGYARYLADGIVRARYRRSREKAEPHRARRRSRPTPSTSGPPATSSRPATASACTSRAATSRASTATRTRASHGRRRRAWSRPSRPCTTTPRIPPR